MSKGAPKDAIKKIKRQVPDQEKIFSKQKYGKFRSIICKHFTTQ